MDTVVLENEIADLRDRLDRLVHAITTSCSCPMCKNELEEAIRLAREKGL